MSEVQKKLYEIPHGSIEEVSATIESNISLIEQHIEFAQSDAQTTDHKRVLYNMLVKARIYLLFLIESLEHATELMAFVTRSLFELNILSKYVLKGEKNLERFLMANVADERDISQGILEVWKDLSEKGFKTAEMEMGVRKVETLMKQNNRLLKKLPNYKDMSITVGLESEYNSFYKLISKYVHPTSYSLNISDEYFHHDVMRNMFILLAHTYAHETFDRIKRETTGEGVSYAKDWTVMIVS